MLALERRKEILEKLMEEKRVVVSELSKKYAVSEETIRRDLEKLEQDGYATKSYGGAILNENVGFDMPLNVRSKRNVEAKQQIASLAAELIHDGDHIMLDASSTDLFLAKALKQKKNLTVVTNSIEIILEFSEIPGWTVISSGGNLREGYLALTGAQAETAMQSYYVDKAFISCKGMDRIRGIMDPVQEFATMKQAILRSSAKKYLLVDHTKFGRGAFAKSAEITDVGAVITDRKPERDWLDYFAGYGIECIYPES